MGDAEEATGMLQLTGMLGGIMGLLSLVLPWVAVTAGGCSIGCNRPSGDVGLIDLVSSATIPSFILVALGAVFILGPGSALSLVSARIGGPVMLGGWMVSAVGIYVVNNQVDVGGVSLRVGSSYGFLVGLAAAAVVCLSGYWHGISKWRHPKGGRHDLETPVALHPGRGLILGGAFVMGLALVALAATTTRGITVYIASIAGFFLAGLAMVGAGALVAWLRGARSKGRRKPPATATGEVEEERRSA